MPGVGIKRETDLFSPYLSEFLWSLYNWKSTFKNKPFSLTWPLNTRHLPYIFYCWMENKLPFIEWKENYSAGLLEISIACQGNIFVTIFQDNVIFTLWLLLWVLVRTQPLNKIETHLIWRPLHPLSFSTVSYRAWIYQYSLNITCFSCGYSLGRSCLSLNTHGLLVFHWSCFPRACL